MKNKQTLIEIPEPKIAKFLFNDSRSAVLWLIVRVYVGWQWLFSGWEKLESPAWVGERAGSAIHGFFMGALAKTAGEHPAVSGWYASFLRFADSHSVFFSYLITFSEIAVGLGLILGLFTGIAAFFGAFMNMNFLLSGTVSINPILGLLQLFLVLAWRVAGFIGVDRFVLPLVGTPWKKGEIFKK